MPILRKLILRLIKVNNRMLFISSVLLISVSSILIVHIEPETFVTYFDGFWWVMTTVTTVGYGDLSPVTTEGRILAIILYILGIGLIGVVIGKVVDGLSAFRKKREEGKLVFKGTGHYIIIGWSEKANYALQEMLKTKKDIQVVIIDEREKAPLLSENIFFVKGYGTSMDTLEKANVKEAESVLIFADDSIQENQLVDGKTLLIASTVESIAPEVHTVVEVMEESHIHNFKHIEVDDFIYSRETISSLAVRTIFAKGISEVYGQLLRHQHGDDLYHIPTREEWHTYGDAFQDLLKEGATLIADGKNLGINRMLDEKIREDAKLYVVCDRSTYDKLIG
ncbi:potassium channel family protein [Salinibacillus xinjiangensis]|uniref:Ion transporter n=1 Tax=Salinibacillus xinjiangensis TaxID=1229268 RepID=A0A6G1X9Q9_9BACI|nr:potassium channel family protein [Salinibacillus xinjiangensis]MRG87751.1 ion transporter [Salinibacillus xinjiangensis]